MVIKSMDIGNEQCEEHCWKTLGLSSYATGQYSSVIKAVIYCEYCGEIRSQEV